MSGNVSQCHEFYFVAAIHNIVVERSSDVVVPISLDHVSSVFIQRRVLVQDVRTAVIIIQRLPEHLVAWLTPVGLVGSIFG